MTLVRGEGRALAPEDSGGGLENARLRVAVTCGEPAGIGAEVALKALLEPSADVEPLLVGQRAVWEAAAALVPGSDRLLRGVPGSPGILELGAPEEPDWSWGQPTERSARLAVEAVEVAARLALEGKVDALVTAPLTKEGLHAAGRPFPGHTELLAALCGPGFHPTMMLAGDRLRVVLVTTHLPLAHVAAAVTSERVLDCIRAAHHGLTEDLGVSAPRLAVCALNPHGGEGGVLGQEEERELVPAVRRAREQGVTVLGPLPADSLFHRAAAGEFDGVVAMYHDQGLVPLKLLHFWDAVNVTFGLPLVRTSPDHGTAFDLAGRGVARADSFREAIRCAAEIARRRRARGAKREK